MSSESGHGVRGHNGPMKKQREGKASTLLANSEDMITGLSGAVALDGWYYKVRIDIQTWRLSGSCRFQRSELGYAQWHWPFILH